MKKLSDIDTTARKNEYQKVAQNLKKKGKLTLSKHFEDAAEIIELQDARIKELENA